MVFFFVGFISAFHYLFNTVFFSSYTHCAKRFYKNHSKTIALSFENFFKMIIDDHRWLIDEPIIKMTDINGVADNR